MIFLCQHNCNYIIKKKKFFFICIFIRVTVQTGYFQPGHNPGQNRINRMKKKPGPIRVDPDEPETDRSTTQNEQILPLRYSTNYLFCATDTVGKNVLLEVCFTNALLTWLWFGRKRSEYCLSKNLSKKWILFPQKWNFNL